MTGNVRKVVLAYSGGLDTSVILRWLKDVYDCEIVTFTADIGQGEEVEPARAKAEMMGVKEIYVEDLRETFVRDYVFPMFRANALYEGTYLLGTSIARPLIAKRQIEILNATGADAVAHGATGKGNDQVRFELTYYALKPDVRVIAPWREWDLNSRATLIDYARHHQIPVPADKEGEAPYSMDANLLHISYEGKALEDPWVAPDEEMFRLSVSPEAAPDRPIEIVIDFERGDPVALDGETLSPAAFLTKLNRIAGANGIGRQDIVENRFVGMKSRGVYETPGGTVLLHAHRAIESLTLDRAAAHLKDEMMPRYAELIYNGFWFAPEREALQALIDQTAGTRHRFGPPEAVQGQRRRQRPEVALQPVRSGHRDVRGRPRLQPARRRRLYPAERAAAAGRRAQRRRRGLGVVAIEQDRDLLGAQLDHRAAAVPVVAPVTAGGERVPPGGPAVLVDPPVGERAETVRARLRCRRLAPTAAATLAAAPVRAVPALVARPAEQTVVSLACHHASLLRPSLVVCDDARLPFSRQIARNISQKLQQCERGMSSGGSAPTSRG